MADPVAASTFSWTTSAGQIVEGQGTSSIVIKSTEAEIKRVTAFVDIGGMHPVCNKTAYATADIGLQPYRLDYVENFLYSDLAARIDNFMISIRNDPTIRGHIIVYEERKSSRWGTRTALASVRRVFAFLRFDMSQITIVEGGTREWNTAEMWIAPPGAAPPVAKPSVDRKICSGAKKFV